MRWIIMVLIMVIAILLVICYALMVTAHDADEKAERMYRAWKEKHTEIPSEITTCVGVAVDLLDDEHEMYEAWKERQKNEDD